ncbi:hypothetical protein CPB83DRAFT_901094 [Crepidotus variabilis]|uniref:Protein-S-isoprenylcysteine O-methyltransferase n=1 Tax=Crepidotus variabilis TaxID=179855 RepID=A0A9P6EUM0_9AGAR|nr:hypothetical protein CPB83DRAFT_901094 [Crepidotus variabilis]
MSLMKIPLLVAVGVAQRSMLTPPHPSLPTSEFSSTTTFDSVITRYRAIPLTIAKFGQYYLSTVEIATILANSTLDRELSKFVLSECVFKGGNPQNMHTSLIAVFGIVLFITGAILRASTYRHLGRFFRYEICIQKDHQLIKTGPYALVRHPSYSGLLVSTMGWFLWTFSTGSWVQQSGMLNTRFGKIHLAAYVLIGTSPPLLVTLPRMRNEDEALKQKFGKEWEAWAAETPYSIIPGLH